MILQQPQVHKFQSNKQPQRKIKMKSFLQQSSLLLLLPILVLSNSGCAYVNSNTRVETGTNGVSVATTHARAYTIFDANAQLTKFRNSTGGPTNTFTQGTAVTGLNESSNASNIVAIINAAASVAAKVP